MVFALDFGQICNNILQFGHVYAWAREHGQRCIGLRFASKYRTGFKVCHKPYYNRFVFYLVKLLAKYHVIPTIEFSEKTINQHLTEKEEVLTHSKNTLVQGWNIRHFNLFDKYYDEILDCFDFEDNIKRHVNALLHSSEVNINDSVVRIGLHIRRGDYKWLCPNYFLSTAEYCKHLQHLLTQLTAQHVVAYVCTNDNKIVPDDFNTICTSTASIVFSHGDALQDLYLLSQCDYIIGAPSTYSLVACMYRKAKLSWITHTSNPVTIDSFKNFDQAVRQYDELFVDIEKTRKRLSIIIPIYNVEKYIDKLFDSIYTQKVNDSDFEVIVVDDGTPDQSIQRILPYAAIHNNLKIIHQENQGLSVARNTGLAHAKGLYIWFVDSDDSLEPGSIDKILTCTRNNPQADILGFALHKVYEDSDKTSYSHPIGGRKDKAENRKYGTSVRHRLLGPTQRFVFKQEFLDRNDLRFYPGLLHEDMEFLYKAFLCCKKFFISGQPIYHYLIRQNGSIMSSLKTKNYEHMTFIIDQLTQVEKQQCHTFAERCFIRYSRFLVLLKIMYARPTKEWKDSYNDLLRQNYQKYMLVIKQSLLPSVLYGSIYTLRMSKRFVKELNKLQQL